MPAGASNASVYSLSPINSVGEFEVATDGGIWVAIGGKRNDNWPHRFILWGLVTVPAVVYCWDYFYIQIEHERMCKAEAGLKVLGREDIRPRHAKAADAGDALHAARAAEVTSLWRLAAA